MLSLDASLYGDLSAHLQSKEKSKSEGFGVAKGPRGISTFVDKMRENK